MLKEIMSVLVAMSPWVVIQGTPILVRDVAHILYSLNVSMMARTYFGVSTVYNAFKVYSYCYILCNNGHNMYVCWDEQQVVNS